MGGPGLPLSSFRWARILALLAVALGCAATAVAGAPNLAKYPLRVHVLASDETHQTPRMSPGESLVCDSIGGMLDSIGPNLGGPITISGVSGDPCSMGAAIVMGRLMDLPEDEAPVFSGSGRGDLVTPPSGTAGLTFTYNDCVRVRVHPGFESLPARWKKQGKRLEVLMPSDDIPEGGRPLPPVKCSLDVALHDFVFLLLPNGKLVEVSKDVYQARPALRLFLRGHQETVQQRAEQFTVPVTALPKK